MNSRKQHSEPARSRILSILPTIHRVSVNLRNTGFISHKNLAQRRPFRRKKIVFLTIDSLNEFFKRVDFHLYSRLCKCVIILRKENHCIVKWALSMSFCPLVKGKKIYGRLKTLNYYGSSHGAQYLAKTRRTRQEKELRKRMK